MISLRRCWILILALAACGGPAETPNPGADADAARSLAGDWRAVLASPGGELPFTLRLDDDGPELRAVVVNGEEEVPFSSVEQRGASVVLRFEWYDSEITAELDPAGESMTGRWRKTVPGGDSTLPFTARRGAAARFLARSPSESSDDSWHGGAGPKSRAEGSGFRGATSAPETTAASSLESVAGHWAVEFHDDDGSEVARGEFAQSGDAVTGTFLTPTGDYRFLEGTFDDGLLRLSTFDGAHAFLFQARARDDDSLEGDFFSRDSYHATWTARRAAADEAILPDAWAAVGLRNDEGDFSFRFPDLEGEMVALDDQRFAGKAVLVNIFGSWCPNCNDEAPLLAAWHRRYRQQGLEIVGLAYEFSGDAERDRALVRRFGERYGIDYPLLLAGVSDKAAAASTLPDLTAVLSYPTTIFIGRDGKVRKIHSGFAGPGTGAHHQTLVAQLEAAIEELLAEPA